jgi:GTPase SAR1 family protein
LYFEQDYWVDNCSLYKEAIKKGKKSWNRTKIMLVGGGRAGKTSLGRALLHKSFEYTPSTEGMDTLSVGISTGASSADGSWDERQKPTSVLEEAIGAMARDMPASPPARESGILSGLKKLICPLRSDAMQLSVTDGVSVDAPTLVRKVASGELGKSGIEVSLYDFGGQDVFSCLHPFFLTRFGVSVVVFNMTWFVDENSATSAAALSCLSFWLNSVVLNTSRQGGYAPIVLVGTHKDEVSRTSEHQRISELLSSTFCRATAWASIIKYDRRHLLFFPVACTRGNDDGVMRDLRLAIEAILLMDTQMKIERPFSWYHALDSLNVIQKADQHSITYERATSVLSDCGINGSDVDEVLGFFRDMGMIIWYPEEALKDVVILDPVAYFVKPVSRIVCNPDLHCQDAHEHVSCTIMQTIR